MSSLTEWLGVPENIEQAKKAAQDIITPTLNALVNDACGLIELAAARAHELVDRFKIEIHVSVGERKPK